MGTQQTFEYFENCVSYARKPIKVYSSTLLVHSIFCVLWAVFGELSAHGLTITCVNVSWRSRMPSSPDIAEIGYRTCIFMTTPLIGQHANRVICTNRRCPARMDSTEHWFT